MVVVWIGVYFDKEMKEVFIVHADEVFIRRQFFSFFEKLESLVAYCFHYVSTCLATITGIL